MVASGHPVRGWAEGEIKAFSKMEGNVDDSQMVLGPSFLGR